MQQLFISVTRYAIKLHDVTVKKQVFFLSTIEYSITRFHNEWSCTLHQRLHNYSKNIHAKTFHTCSTNTKTRAKHHREKYSSYMTSTKNSQGLPMAMRKDWRLPERSGGREPRGTGWPGGREVVPTCTCRALARLVVSDSLPLPMGEADLRSPFSLPSFLLLPEWLLPAGAQTRERLC